MKNISDAQDIKNHNTMPIPKKELNKRKREERKKLGLVEFRTWCTPKHRREHEALKAKHEEKK